MENVLKFEVEKFTVIVEKATSIESCGLETFQKTGFQWSVWQDGKVKRFDTLIYCDKTYTPQLVAKYALYFIANLEKTPSKRFAKSAFLVAKYLG